MQSKWVTDYLTAVILRPHTNITGNLPQHSSHYIDEKYLRQLEIKSIQYLFKEGVEG